MILCFGETLSSPQIVAEPLRRYCRRTLSPLIPRLKTKMIVVGGSYRYTVRIAMVLALSCQDFHFLLQDPWSLDPGADFKAPGSLTHHQFGHLLEGFSKGS